MNTGETQHLVARIDAFCDLLISEGYSLDLVCDSRSGQQRLPMSALPPNFRGGGKTTLSANGDLARRSKTELSSAGVLVQIQILSPVNRIARGDRPSRTMRRRRGSSQCHDH